MKYISTIILAAFLGLSASAQTLPASQPDSTDWKMQAQGYRAQRDQSTQALQDVQLQLVITQQQLKDAQEKIASLTPKPKPETKDKK